LQASALEQVDLVKIVLPQLFPDLDQAIFLDNKVVMVEDIVTLWDATYEVRGLLRHPLKLGCVSPVCFVDHQINTIIQVPFQPPLHHEYTPPVSLHIPTAVLDSLMQQQGAWRRAHPAPTATPVPQEHRRACHSLHVPPVSLVTRPFRDDNVELASEHVAATTISSTTLPSTAAAHTVAAEEAHISPPSDFRAAWATTWLEHPPAPPLIGVSIATTDDGLHRRPPTNAHGGPYFLEGVMLLRLRELRELDFGRLVFDSITSWLTKSSLLVASFSSLSSAIWNMVVSRHPWLVHQLACHLHVDATADQHYAQSCAATPVALNVAAVHVRSELERKGVS
jgi:hypothetical protein